MLKPKKRLIRREIKEDPLVTKYIQIQKLAQNYSKQINIGLIVIAVIVVLSILMARSKRSAEIAATANLGVAEMYYHNQNYDRALTELLVIAETYPGTQAAGNAVYFIANIYFIKHIYPDAEKYYQIYTGSYSDHRLFTGASLAGIAACKETTQQYSESADFYLKAAKKDPDSFQTPFYLQSAGRCFFLAGQSDKGREVFLTILDEYPNAPIIQDVKLSLGAL